MNGFHRLSTLQLHEIDVEVSKDRNKVDSMLLPALFCIFY